MKKEELLKELERVFAKTKKELGFQASFEELDKEFYVKDSILKEGFVGENFSRQLCHRIIETLGGWNEYLHSLIMPNPQNMLNISESRIFSQEEKKEIMELIKKLMEISSKNSLIALSKDKKAESEFIDYTLKFWNREFKPKIIKIMEKINNEWRKSE